MVPPFFTDRATAPRTMASPPAAIWIDKSMRPPQTSNSSEQTELSGLTPLQAPQSTRREDGRERPGHAERDERPDPEKDSAGVGDPTANKSRSPHVEDKDAQRTGRPEEHDDVPRS